MSLHSGCVFMSLLHFDTFCVFLLFDSSCFSFASIFCGIFRWGATLWHNADQLLVAGSWVPKKGIKSSSCVL